MRIITSVVEGSGVDVGTIVFVDVAGIEVLLGTITIVGVGVDVVPAADVDVGVLVKVVAVDVGVMVAASSETTI